MLRRNLDAQHSLEEEVAELKREREEQRRWEAKNPIQAALGVYYLLPCVVPLDVRGEHETYHADAVIRGGAKPPRPAQPPPPGAGAAEPAREPALTKEEIRDRTLDAMIGHVREGNDHASPVSGDGGTSEERVMLSMSPGRK